MHLNPRWLVDVSTGSAWRFALVCASAPIAGARAQFIFTGGRPNRAPAWTVMCAVYAVSCFDGLLNLFLDGLQIERCALLHRRKFDRCPCQLPHLLLHIGEAPELASVKGHHVVRRANRPVPVGITLERITTQVVNQRHVELDLFAGPAVRLRDEDILPIADPYRTQRRFTEVEYLLRLLGPLPVSMSI